MKGSNSGFIIIAGEMRCSLSHTAEAFHFTFSQTQSHNEKQESLSYLMLRIFEIFKEFCPGCL